MTAQPTKGQVVFITQLGGSSMGGGSIMTCALLQAFSMLYGERLAIIARPEIKNVPLPRIPAEFVSVPPRSLLQKAWWMMTFRGIDRLSPFVDRWLEKTELNRSVVVLNTSRAGRFAPVLQRRGVPVVTIHYNVEVDYVRDIKESAVWYPLGKYIVEKNEHAAFTHSVLNLTFTPDDGHRLRELYDQSNDTIVKALGCFERMDSAPLPPLSLRSRAANPGIHIVSTGSLCTHQTEDGIVWFISSMLPRIREILPNIQYTVAGRSPTPSLRRLAKMDEVRLVADPPDMTPILDEADLYLSPIRMGSGIKLRLMDALRAGLPVVSHTVSARGYTGLIPDDLLVAFNTEAECIYAVQRMAELLPLDLPMRQKIQERYASQFAFDPGVQRLRGLMQEFLPEWAHPDAS